MVELGFIHGRFQLFHNDHLNYALLAKAQCKKLIVGITSPENAALIREEIDPHRSEAASNPFTYYERFNMVKAALLEAGIPREDFEIVPYPIERPEILYNYVPLSATSFFTIYDDWGYEKLHRLGELGYGTYVLVPQSRLQQDAADEGYGFHHAPVRQQVPLLQVQLRG